MGGVAVGISGVLAVFFVMGGNPKPPPSTPVVVERSASPHPPDPAPVVAKAPVAPAPVKAASEPTSVRITFPASGEVYHAPASVRIEAEANEGSGKIERVEFYHGPIKLGEVDAPPYRFVWKDVRYPGEYPLTAKAITVRGETIDSPEIVVQVRREESVATASPGAKAEPVDPAAPSAVVPPAPVARPSEPAASIPASAPPVNRDLDARRVDEAIRNGVNFLKSHAVAGAVDPDRKGPKGLAESPELLLWTLLQAGVRETDPDFQKLFSFVTGQKLQRTYAVALQAMILEELNRVKYQNRIAMCARFLVDNQCQNGQWSYEGQAIDVPSTAPKPSVATSRPEAAGERVKPKVNRLVMIYRMREGPSTGDNSNSQYAALGLRACEDAGVVIPRDVLERARKWWRDSQHDAEKSSGVATGAVSAAPAGWCYGAKTHGHAAYGSMTAGAVGSLAILGHLLDDKNWKRDPALLKGLAWLDQRFSVTGNEGPSEHVANRGWMLGYYLYALERAGVLCGTETFGAHRWYAEGCEAILRAQRPDGSWLSPLPHHDRSDVANAAWDTSFAVLFLKRATRPLVASADERPR